MEVKSKIKLSQFLSRWRHWWPQLIIIGVWLLIVLTNFMPGTWLTGWDNLHPEWDPTYDLWRSFNAVWQEYQGVGLLGGMAHSSDLVRQVIVLLMTGVIPRSLIRYTLLFAGLLSGALGAYHLFSYLFTDRSERLVPKIASLAAALFHLLNLGTVQNFYVAFEPYYWFYGLLPWLLHALFHVWRTPDQRGWLRFTLLSFLATPLAYLQTNFVVYAVLLVACGLSYLVARRPQIGWRDKLTRLLGSAVIVTLTNLFWLAPMFYFVLTGGSQTTIRSQINQMSTREVTVQNQAYNNIENILLLRGYWFAGQDYDSTDDQEAPIAFMETWMSESATTYLGYFFAGMMIVGMVYLLVYRRDYRSYGIIAGFVCMCGLLLVNRLDSALLSQIFRSPFTKVIVPLSLLYSLLVGASFLFWARILQTKFLVLTFGFFVMFLGMYAIPAFGGHFIYHNLRPQVPDDYEQLFAFMRTQPDASRTALLPAETVYGWQHMTWGYRGIGFYWFGLRQAILDRAFDVWSFDNEEFYQELHYARLLADRELFAHVLQKYDVRYLIYDQGIHRRGRDSDTFHQTWLDLIKGNCDEVHSTDLIQVYDCGAQSDQYIQTPSSYYISNTSQFHQFYDPASRGDRHYVTGDEKQAIDLPFAYLYEREPTTDLITYHESTPGSRMHTVDLSADLTGTNYDEIFVPTLLEASLASFLVSVDVVDEETYQVLVKPLYSLYVNGKEISVFPTIGFMAPALPDKGQIYFDFGTDYTLLTPGEASNSAIVALGNFDQDQVWRYFPAGRARSRGININVNLQDTVELDVPTNFWDRLRESQTIKLKEPVESLTAKVVTDPIYLRSFATNDAVNCDVIYRGAVNRQPDGEHGYSYQVSGHGSYCDTFYDSRLDGARHSFFIRADARNFTGLPLTFYFWDINQQVQSWETLLPSGDVTQTFSFPRMNVDEPTAYFDIHTANRSIAGEEAYNILDQVVAYIMPLHELAGIELRGRDSQSAIRNPLHIFKVIKSGTSQYRVRAELTGQQTGLLVLTQGYHDGWTAKANGQTLEHRHFDDWANAWIIDSSVCPDGKCDIRISFWPQWLGWLGLAVSLATAGAAGSGWIWLLWQRHHHDTTSVGLRGLFAGHKK